MGFILKGGLPETNYLKWGSFSGSRFVIRQ